MPNLNQLIYTAADYKILLLVPNAAGVLFPFPLQTVASFDRSTKVDSETIHALGEINPIGVKANGRAYSGKFEVQVGEMEGVLLTTGKSDPTDINGAQLAITTYDGLVAKVYSGVNVISADSSVKAKDKQSLYSCNWEAVSLT